MKNYYELSHPVYGIWYASSGYKAANIVKCTISYFYQKSKLYNSFMIKGWVVTKVSDLDDIPYCFIDRDNSQIYNL